MNQKLTTFLFDDFSSGMIDDKSVSNSLFPKNAVRKAMNVRFDYPHGSVSQRYGTTALGTGIPSAGNTITGLHNYRSATTSNHNILASASTVIRQLTGGAWADSLTGLTSGLKTRFITFCNRVAFLNGTDAVQSFDGSGWSNSSVLDEGNFPRAKYAAILNGRLFAAGVSSQPSRLYGSSIVSTSNTISWVSGNQNIDVSTNDEGGVITSLKSNGKVLLIFKDRSLFRYDGNELAYITGIGTSSHESVITDDNGITAFFGVGSNGVGFYITQGGYPKKISRPITKWIEAISASFYDDIAGFTDGVKYYWSVGSLTIDGITYSNAWLVYTIADQTWEARNYADSYRVFSQYIDSNGNLTVVGGDTDGYVQTIDSGTTDNGSPINAECEFAPIYFTSRSHLKSIDDCTAFAQDFQGLLFSIKVDSGNFKSIGSIDSTEKRFSFIPKLKGSVFYPRISAVNSQEPFVFDGFEFNEVYDEGLI